VKCRWLAGIAARRRGAASERTANPQPAE